MTSRVCARAGEVEVVSEDCLVRFDLLKEGQSFGEDGWLQNELRSASHRSCQQWSHIVVVCACSHVHGC